jgi:hypothetical protein
MAMGKKSKVAIVIPIYRVTLNKNEMISLQQATKILGDYQFIIVAPENLKIEMPITNGIIEYFPIKYFDSVDSYNILMLSEFFYERFINYEYILIYQLDAFVFSNQIERFCSLGYAYIGAPWLSGLRNDCNERCNIFHVGNGGLSLRNVEKFLRIFDKRQEKVIDFRFNEDIFWASMNSDEFRVATLNVALQFAFESEVEKCFRMNHNKLPFGCHAWEKYNFNFWRPYISQMGYDVNSLDIDGNLDLENSKLYEENEMLDVFWSDDKGLYDGKICINNPENRKLLIWGTGMYGKRMLRIMERLQLQVYGFIDNNSNNYGNLINGIAIYPPKIICDNCIYMVIIAIYGTSGDEVKNQMIKMGKTYCRDFISFKDTINLDK